MKNKGLKTYIANPYNSKRGISKKRTHLTKNGQIWKNDLMNWDMTSQRGI